jgi:DNA mismatch repair protein MutS2
VKHVSAGDQVRLKSMNKIAVVQREVEKDLFEVTLGPIKMRVKRDDIAEVLQTADSRTSAETNPLTAARKQKNVHVTLTSSNTDDMRMEINLIGRTVDEATADLEKYLDRAFLAGLPRIRVIHGHGAGILRRGVREFLKGHPHVATLTEAPQNEGGQGATLVELRQ